MVRIEAPEDTVFMTVDTMKRPLDAQKDHIYAKVNYLLSGDMARWCRENHIAVPDVQYELQEYGTAHVRTVKYLCFSHDADAVKFKLLWEKGCAST